MTDATTPQAGRSPVPEGFRRLRDDARRLLLGWQAPDDEQDALRLAYLRHLDAHEGATWREGPPAHLTVGLLVLDPTGERVLLTHHRKARRWFQLGGHLEEQDASVAAAALREGVEESGIAGLRLLDGVVQLDRHALPGAFGRCREHLDVRFAAVADAGALPVVSPESLDVAWFDTGDLPEPELAPLVVAGRRALAAGTPRG